LHESDTVHQLIWWRYSEYLASLKDAEYRDAVFRHIDQEDSLRSVTYQLELLTTVGFTQVEILHKNLPRRDKGKLAMNLAGSETSLPSMSWA
jgi:tRNA (cmo5U34)-methyltransferase